MERPEEHPLQQQHGVARKYGATTQLDKSTQARRLFLRQRNKVQTLLKVALNSIGQQVVVDLMFDPIGQEWHFMVNRAALRLQTESMVHLAGSPKLIDREALSNDLRDAKPEYLDVFYEVMDILREKNVAFYLSWERKEVKLKVSPAPVEAMGERLFGPIVRELHFYVLVVNRRETLYRLGEKKFQPLSDLDAISDDDDESLEEVSPLEGAEPVYWHPNDIRSSADLRKLRQRVRQHYGNSLGMSRSEKLRMASVAPVISPRDFYDIPLSENDFGNK